jgi:hypothetical protein
MAEKLECVVTSKPEQRSSGTHTCFGYYPTNKNGNAVYRKIQIKTLRKDIAISHPAGVIFQSIRGAEFWQAPI